MNKYYYELIIKPDTYYELYLDLAISLVDEAIEELDGTIIVRSENNLNDIQAGVEAFAIELSKAFNADIKCPMTLEKKENIDWIKVYQDSVQPVVVSNFYIHPSWEDPKQNMKNILIDPALTFGSGHHETTSTCLEMIGKYVKKDSDIIDVGCGSGILGIASAKLGANVDICDTDIIAVEDSIKNFKVNAAKCIDSWEGSCNKATKTYDIVIANIVADVLAMIHKDLKKVTAINGLIILSGIMDKHQDKVLRKFQDCKLIEKIQKNEWITLVVKKVK